MSDSLQKKDPGSNGSIDKYRHAPNRGNAFNTKRSGLEPRKIIAILLKYKWVVLLFLICGAAAAWFYANSVTPLYRSSGTLMISTGAHSADDQVSQIISQLTGYGTNSTVKNELQILQSRKFSRHVADRFIEQVEEDAQHYPILWQETETGELQRASVNTVANRIRNNLNFYQVAEETDAIEVAYKSPSPREAAKIVNLVMQTYVDRSTQINRQAASATANYLKQEKEKYKERLEAAEAELRRYMNATGNVQINQQASALVSSRANVGLELQRVNLALRAVEENIAQYNERLERMRPGLTEQFTEAPGARIENLQEMLASYELERSMIIAKNPGVYERDPVPARLIYLDDQIARTKEMIGELSNSLFTSNNKFTGMNSEDRAKLVSSIQLQLAELKMQRNQLQSKQEALRSYQNEVDAEFGSLPEGMITLAKLKRNVRMNEELYMSVAQQYAEIAVLEQSQSGFGRIIDPAIITNAPVSPDKKLFILLGLMLGGFLAVGFIGFREFRDNSVNTVEQLKTDLLPPLTIIPEIDKTSQDKKKSFKTGEGKIPQEVVMLLNNTSIPSEAIRRLKNNIIFQSGERPPKSIAITSPEKGDGKSTITANLAIAMAEEGYWTLVIDADFRRPKLYKYFGLPQEFGLFNFLNNEIPFENVLKDTDMERLKFISAGTGIEIPEIINNSAKLKRLLEKMEEVFDVIIIDTPPYGVVSDSATLLKYAEKAVVVAKYRKTNKGMLLKTMDELKEIGANVTSIVLNVFDHKKETGNYYGNGYYQTLYSNYEEYL